MIHVKNAHTDNASGEMEHMETDGSLLEASTNDDDSA